MAVLLGILLGVIVGAALIGEGGILPGGLLGWLTISHLAVARRLHRLEQDRAEESRATATAQADDPQRPLPGSAAPDSPAPSEDSSSVPADTPAALPSRSSADSPLAGQLRALVFGGNPAARLGVVVLFFGVAFLLKYAADQRLLPIELRLAAAALGGIALLGIGWRLRMTRRGYSLVLQGGGVGVLYLTVFAAFHFYQLLAIGVAFPMLVSIGISAAALAILQDSIALAIFGVVGGFLAPILVSTDTGNHVLLFSYYAILNAGILLIGWFKRWRLLNLAGFVFTFAIAALWGQHHYEPQLFSSTEPFLILFFLMYVMISVRFATLRPRELNDYVDGTLVFGVPIVGFVLQAALVREFEYGLAWSAFALGLFYLLLATAVLARGGGERRLLVEAFLALGVIFATLAIPLAFDGRWTSAAWAVEGAGIFWIGIRQQRIAARLFGGGLILVSGGLFLADRPAAAAWPFLNAHYVGSLLVSLSALIAAGQAQRHLGTVRPVERPIALILLGWGLLWWYGAGAIEIDQRFPAALSLAATGTFVALSCITAEALGTRRSWPALRASSLLLLPVLIALFTLQLLEGAHPFARAGYILWISGLGAFYWIARRRMSLDNPRWIALQHAAALWLVTLIGARELAWVADTVIHDGHDWVRAAWLLVPAAVLALVVTRPVRWPFGTYRDTYTILGGSPVAGLGLLAFLLAVVNSGGEPEPLPYLPLVNPLDLSTAILGIALVRWLMAVREVRPAEFAQHQTVVIGFLMASAFLWMNAILFRTLHHHAGIDYDAQALFASVLVQASVSLCWGVLALILVVAATRLQFRTLWLTAAALLGVVVAKLFLVDLSNTGTVARIVSFLGVGALLLLVGYLSPVPPRATKRVEGT